MTKPIENLRIHFYGIQGSGSTFPAKAERAEIRKRTEIEMLEEVFIQLQKRIQHGDLERGVEGILGGPINQQTLEAYHASLVHPEQRIYGGWTTCFRIETSDGYDLVFDCGSGFRICASDIMKKWGEQDERHLYIFGSHAHFDHTEGFDQAEVCFDPRNHIHISANYQFLKSLDQNLGIFSHEIDMELQGIQTPLSYELMPAHFDSTEIRDLTKNPPVKDDPMVGKYHDINEPIIVGNTKIQPFEVFHPDPCLAYRIEHNGKVFIYCTDHELRHGDNPEHPLQIASHEAEKRLIELSMNADVMYRDGQFLRIEYDGEQGIGTPLGVSRKDWGHSCIEDVAEMAEHCNIGRTYIGHHDPNRTWAERNWIDETLARQSEQSGRHVEMARAETVIDL